MKKLFDFLSKFVYLLFIDMGFLLWYYYKDFYNLFESSSDLLPITIGFLLKVFLVLFLVSFLVGTIGKLVLFIKEIKHEKKSAITNDDNKEHE